MINRTLVLLLSFMSFSLFAEEQQHSARLVVHLLDYLAKDYPGAVDESGKIISESEYAEQVEFANTAFKASSEIPELAAREDIKNNIKSLHDSISAKAGPSKVTALARSIQVDLLAVTHLEVSPLRWPNREKAAKLFADNCSICHGASGAGDGPGGIALEPKPANFLDHEKMNEAAPLGEFNTIRLGVPGTGMAAFQNFSDEETWGLAFYVISLRHEKPTENIQLNFDDNLLKQAATLSDTNLAKVLGVDVNEKNGKLATVRYHQENSEKVNTLDLSRTYLHDAEEAYKNGDQKSAKSSALRSYLEGIEPVEPRLKAQDPALVSQLETVMFAVRGAIEKNASPDELHTAVEAALAKIDQADDSLKSKGIDSRVAFAAASGILLREGFEAALIILSLLSVVNALGARRAALWVHAGWVAALALGVVCWFVLGVLFDISGAQRELLEGGTSLVAVLVLIGVGFWLHRHSEIGRWTRFIKTKVKTAVDGKNLIGLATISFLAVFREAIESVLFLRVIWFDADNTAKTAMMTGTGLTLTFIIVSCWAAVKYSAKLPISQLFRISAYIMAVLAFILTGKGIHALQESGLISINHILPHLRWELIGIYPSTETLLAQVVIMSLIAFLWIQGRKPSEA
ncbi:MAG: cytochrome c/FTR1 family iron permease [Oligoflexus sp.]|nr:cytochrome c/FTR1 family iron permease [Oligoflexus sp.]